jgi:hypothetical protein
MAERRPGGGRGIRGSSAWKKLLDEEDHTKLPQRFERVLKEISDEDVEILVGASGPGDDRERQRAIATVGLLARSNDARLKDAQRTRWIRELVGAAEAGYPRTLLGRTAFEQLRRLDPKGAEQLLVDRVDVRALDESQREEFVRALSRYVSPAAVSRLEEMARLGGRPGEVATTVLEGRGLLGLEQIEDLAKQWRSSRSPDLLHSLYLRYVANQVGKVSIRDVVALLGRPDRRDGNLVWYMPNSATALFLEGDAKGLLSAAKFT